MAKRTIRDYLQGKDHRWSAGGPVTHEEQNAVNKLKHDDPSTWPDTDKWKATGREGVCFALSTYWIIKGDDFWTWLGGYSTPGPQVGDIKDLMKKQSDEITHFGQGGKFNLACTTIEKNSPLRHKTINEFMYAKLDPSTNKDFFVAGYKFVSIKGKYTDTKTGAEQKFRHAIAVRIGAKCRYFDPNDGEFEVDSLAELGQELGDVVNTRYKLRDAKVKFMTF